MEVWIAEVFDYSYEVPMMVGVYSTEQQAWDAIEIVVTRCSEKNKDIVPDQRWQPTVTPIQLNGFTPAVMDWLGYE